jgi:hypothetical protein
VPVVSVLEMESKYAAGKYGKWARVCFLVFLMLLKI